MIVYENQYVPVLKWRTAEYQSLYRLRDTQKPYVVPLFIIPPVEYDFENRRLTKSIQEHIDNFLDKYKKKWGERKAFIDLYPPLFEEKVDSKEYVFEYIFSSLRSEKSMAIPVVSALEASLQQGVEVTLNNNTGIAIRLTLEEIIEGKLHRIEKTLFSELNIDRSNIDLIIDLQKPNNFEPIDDFASALVMHIGSIKHLNEYRSFILISTSIRLNEIENPGGILLRYEWNLYKELIKPHLGLIRRPTFGDYTIETPYFAPDLDFRKISPAAKIVYTVPSKWIVYKGKSYRSDTTQMKSLSRQIINSQYYSGPDFSFGDFRIKEVAEETRKPGNPTTMKQVGISHHMSFILNELSMIPVTQNTP